MDALQSVSVNPWLRCAVLLTLRLFLPGLAWCWVIPQHEKDGQPGWVLWAVRGAAAGLIGVVVSVLSTIVLAEMGAYSVGVEWTVILGVTVAGMILGLRFHGSELWRVAGQGLPAAILFAVATIVIMALPQAGEWILGGWDPGVYQNQGIAVARTGTFRAEAQPCYAGMGEAGIREFTRGDGEYREAFPGIPLDSDSRTFEHYFFRGTPALVAAVARSGGLRAATRVNMFAGVLAVLIFFAFLSVCQVKPWQALVTTFFLMTQPAWLHQLHIPTSEMLQLLLVCGIGLLLPFRSKGVAPLILLGVTVFAALLNRLSFLPFVCVLVLGLSWLDLVREDRRRVALELGVLVLAIVGGVLFDVTVTSVTLIRLEKVFVVLVRVAVLSVVLAGLLMALGTSRKARELVRGLPWWLSLVVFVIVCVVMALSSQAGRMLGLKHTSEGVRGVLPFVGYAITVLAAGGGLLLSMARKPGPGKRALRVFVLFLLAATGTVLIKDFTKTLFPWTMRRHLAYTIPAVAILAGVTIAFLAERRAAWGKVAAAVLVLGVLGCTAKRSWHAWSRTNYDGVSVLIKEMAGRIQANDVLIVDDPQWGVPLTFIHGKQVLNGKHLWSRKDAGRMNIAMDELRRLRDAGMRIRFLTSTRTLGMRLYPVTVNVTLDWESGETVFEEIIQHERAEDYEVLEMRNVFRLYTWKPKAEG